MTEALVRAERSPLTARDTHAALRAAWLSCPALDGEPPTRRSLLVLMAQVWLETAQGASSFGWNLAGIKYTRGCGTDYYQVQTHEVVGGKPVTVIAAFRSYVDLDAAARDYVRLIHGQFGYAWPAVQAGDVADFAHRLRARGYYTAPEGQYAAGLRALYALLERELPADTSPVPGGGASLDGSPLYVPPDPDA